jgi:hypothetical protein
VLARLQPDASSGARGGRPETFQRLAYSGSSAQQDAPTSPVHAGDECPGFAAVRSFRKGMVNPNATLARSSESATPSLSGGPPRYRGEHLPPQVGNLYPHDVRAVQLSRGVAIAHQACKKGYSEAVRQHNRFSTAIRAARQQSKRPHPLSSCPWQLLSSSVVALRFRMRLIGDIGNVPADFLLDGCNR